MRIITLVGLISCKGEESKYEFINDILENPQSINNYLLKEGFRADPFRGKYCIDDSSRKLFTNKLEDGIRTRFKSGYSLYCDHEIKDFNYEHVIYDRVQEIIIISSDNVNMLKFQWVLLYTRWHLLDIYFTKDEKCIDD